MCVFALQIETAVFDLALSKPEAFSSEQAIEEFRTKYLSQNVRWQCAIFRHHTSFAWRGSAESKLHMISSTQPQNPCKKEHYFWCIAGQHVSRPPNLTKMWFSCPTGRAYACMHHWLYDMYMIVWFICQLINLRLAASFSCIMTIWQVPHFAPWG